MARHEELEEEYIDAYFALLMEEIGLEEGKRLERENKHTSTTRARRSSSWDVCRQWTTPGHR